MCCTEQRRRRREGEDTLQVWPKRIRCGERSNAVGRHSLRCIACVGYREEKILCMHEMAVDRLCNTTARIVISGKKGVGKL